MAKENQLYLRKNKDRQSEKHPEYKGSGNVLGTDVWLAAWVNADDQTGEKYFNIKVTPKEQPRSVPKSVPAADGPNDDIPF